MPSILFAHENYPAQFGALANHLARRGWNVVFATQRKGLSPGRPRQLPSGVHLVKYERARAPDKTTHPYLANTEFAVLNGQALARVAAGLAKGGFTPDIIVAHSGWGSGSFAKVVWPQATLIQYLEWWYSFPPVELEEGFRFTRPDEDRNAHTLVRNLPFLLDMQQADVIWAPTRFQAAQLPEFLRARVVVQHDGVECARFHPARQGPPPPELAGIPQDAPLVTFATRGMEPIRGFPTFMAAISRLQAENPKVHVAIAGNPRAHYGPEPPDFPNWKARALAQHEFDHARLHFTGFLNKPAYADLLRRSQAHVYLTQPFVLSWSLIEAAAAAAPLVASRVDPVCEALGSDPPARLVNPGDALDCQAQIAWCLNNPQAAQKMGAAARDRAKSHFDAAACHASLRKFFHHLLDRKTEDPAA